VSCSKRHSDINVSCQSGEWRIWHIFLECESSYNEEGLYKETAGQTGQNTDPVLIWLVFHSPAIEKKLINLKPYASTTVPYILRMMLTVLVP